MNSWTNYLQFFCLVFCVFFCSTLKITSTYTCICRGFLLVLDKLQTLKQLVTCTAASLPSRQSLANLQRQVECANAQRSQGPVS